LVIFDFPARKAGGEEQARALRALAEWTCHGFVPLL
jgi:hypothetical protein